MRGGKWVVWVGGTDGDMPVGRGAGGGACGANLYMRGMVCVGREGWFIVWLVMKDELCD